jgi:hypothetical protein
MLRKDTLENDKENFGNSSLRAAARGGVRD